MAASIKQNDTVQVIAGDDKGKTGRVLRVDYVRGKVVVEGVNRVYKHVRPSQRNPQGGRLQVERPINISNVLPLSGKTNRGVRVRFVVDADGSKKRVGVDGYEFDTVAHAKKK